MTDSFLVCGPLLRKLQGQAVEGRTGDLSPRIELISLPHPQASPPLSPFSVHCLSLKVTTISLSSDASVLSKGIGGVL